MKVLILGGTGMLGYTLWQVFAPQFDTYVTLRGGFQACPHRDHFDPGRTVDSVSTENFDSIIRTLARIRPDVVVNCIGVVKQHERAKDPLSSIAINAYFPHRLAQLCRASGCRLLHVSTDCVFSGNKGNYAESDVPDATDLYGRTKLLGEVDQPGCLTVRTSIIGRELGSAHGLIEWFLRQKGKSIHGYKKAIFSGLTTRALADIFACVIKDYPSLHGVWHVAAEPVSKYDLLTLAKNAYRLDVDIQPDETFRCDRSLNGERFRRQTKLVAPPWPRMLEQMCA